MKIKFWGVRGSIPTPGAGTVLFGGNTSCVSADFGDDLIIFDAGTGIRVLGEALLQRPRLPRLHLFLSHSHWDHIQGFPFFAPAYRSDCALTVYGAGHADQSLGRILAGQMEGPTFPVALDQLDATISYCDLEAGAVLDLGNPDFAKVHVTAGRHPNGVLVYRLEDRRTHRVLVYATDTEHDPDRIDERILDAARNADLLIYDGMYTPAEYDVRRGWGHSTWEKGLDLALAADVRRLAVFHHDPAHNDGFLTALEKTAVEKARSIAPAMEVGFAREGLEIALDSRRV